MVQLRKKNYFHKQSFLIHFSNIILAIYFLGTFFPLMKVLPIDRNIICFFCALCFLFCYFANIFSSGGKIKKKILFILAVYLLMILSPYIVGNSLIAHRYIGCTMVFLAPIIFDFYKSNNALSSLKRIVIFVAFFAIITGIITYYNLLTKPYIIRSFKSGEISDSLSKQGIGSYEFVYFVMVVGMPILFVFLNEKRFFKKLFYFILYAFCLLFIIKANYLNAFITFLVCSLITLLGNYFICGSSARKILILFSCFLLLFLIFNANSLLTLFGSFLPNRINIVIDSGTNNIFNSIYEEFLEDRWPTLLSSIKAFSEHPLLGLILSDNLEVNSAYLTGFGQHSYILDTFALYGLLFGICNFVVICMNFEFFKGKRINALTLAIVACAVSVYFLNNATESIALAIGIVYPLVREEYKNYSPKKTYALTVFESKNDKEECTSSQAISF